MGEGGNESGTYRRALATALSGLAALAPAVDLDGSMFVGEAVLAHRLGRAVNGII